MEPKNNKEFANLTNIIEVSCIHSENLIHICNELKAIKHKLSGGEFEPHTREVPEKSCIINDLIFLKKEQTYLIGLINTTICDIKEII